MSQLELFRERACIIEFDGKIPRIHAEELARREIFHFWPITQVQRKEFESAGWSAGKALRFLGRQ